MDRRRTGPVKRRNRKPCVACKRRKSGCYRDNPNEPCLACRMRHIECVTSGNWRSSQNPAEGVSFDVYSAGRRTTFNVKEKNDCEPAGGNPIGPIDVVGSDFKSVFAGFTGDTDPWLLRKLQDTNGTIEIPRTGARAKLVNVATMQEELPAFFFIFPRKHVDSRPGEYWIEPIQRVAEGSSSKLLDVYFREIHPHFPVFSKARFESYLESKKVTATLFGVLHVLASYFCDDSKDLVVIEDFLAKAVPLEAYAATLQTVLCMLLYLQIPPHVIREPNFPGHWTLTASLVAQAQELGLNVNCDDWSIPYAEKKERKRLWWAVYVQDKWESLGFSRPSHIGLDCYNVPKLELSDFEETFPSSLGDGQPEPSSISCFLGLCDLSIILSRVLREFYSMKEVQLGEADICQARKLLTEVEMVGEKYGGVGKTDDSCGLSFVICVATLQLVICRKFLGHADTYIALESYAQNTVASLITTLKQAGILGLSGFWWSYSRVNFSLIGSILVSLHFASKLVAESHCDWLRYIEEYRHILSAFSKVTQVTELARLRYENLLNISQVLMPDPDDSGSTRRSPMAGMSADQERDTLGDPALFFEWVNNIGI